MTPRVVHKFPLLNSNDWQAVPVGAGAQVALVDLDPQTGVPSVWIDHRPGSWPENGIHQYRVYPTGVLIGEPAEHVGSFIDPIGLVWHVYQRVS